MTSIPHLLLSECARVASARCLDPLVQAGRLRVTTLPPDGCDKLSDEQLSSVTGAFLSRDLHLAPSAAGNESLKSLVDALKRAPKLEWLQIFFAGVDAMPSLRRFSARGVQVTTASGAASVAIAHSVVAAVMAISRGFLHHMLSQRQRKWSPLRDVSIPAPIAGQRATIVGLGPIGLEIARLLRMLDMHVVGVRTSEASAEHCHQVLRYEDLGHALPTTDWLIVACPLTIKTHRLIDKAALKALPAGAKLVNIARGDVMDQASLIEALRSGNLSAAYLDVFSTEPLPNHSPLWEFENVLISAHTAGEQSDYDANVASIFEGNLLRFLDQMPLKNIARADPGV